MDPASVEKMAYPLPDKPSFAVLAFENLSKDPELEYLSDGFTDTLIGGLSRIPDIFVIARTSTFAYKGKPITIKQIAEELGVQYVVEGSIQQSEEELRAIIDYIQDGIVLLDLTGKVITLVATPNLLSSFHNALTFSRYASSG